MSEYEPRTCGLVIGCVAVGVLYLVATSAALVGLVAWLRTVFS
jgi:hypothetical protein